MRFTSRTISWCVAFVAIVICGCQKQEDKFHEEAAHNLQKIKTAANTTPRNEEAVHNLREIKTTANTTERKGEAFIVLKSDKVVCLADMQILCFRADFKHQLASWKKQWGDALENVTEYIDIKNPSLQTKLKQLDVDIAAQLSKTTEILEANYTKDQLMEFLVHELEGKKTLAENQIAYLKVQDGEFFQRVKSRLDGYSELLIQLKAGGAGAEEIVAAWIRADGMSRINEINKDVKGLAKYRVKDLRSQRAKVIDDAIEKTRDELNNDFKNAFYQMLKLHLVASVRTGSKGDFSVPAETAYVYAELERDNGEHLIWMIQVNASSPEIRLSNSNTSKFWMLGLNME